LSEDPLEGGEITIVGEDGEPSIGPIQGMIDEAALGGTKGSSHGSQISRTGLNGPFVVADVVRKKPTPRFWFSYLRLSLLGLIILVLLIGGWLGRVVRSAQVQREAVAAIQRAGGRVEYDWQYDEKGHLDPNGKPWGPKWLVDRVGADCFGNVVRVFLNNGGSDAELFHVGHLDRLGLLDLERSCVTDAGLAHLGGLPSLWWLTLKGTQVDDAGLAGLEGLTRLQSLSLSNTKVSDAGLVHLKGLSSLQDLHLSGTNVSDAGSASLKGMTHLRTLSLGGTKVTDAGLHELQQALPDTLITYGVLDLPRRGNRGHS
jgi:hypothetical protein